jgi:hypothetical protein
MLSAGVGGRGQIGQLVDPRLTGEILGGLGQVVDPRHAGQILSAQYKANVPKESGILQRTEGLASDLEDLQLRIENFIGRVAGDVTGKKDSAPTPAGIVGHLLLAETRLRECLVLVQKLNDAF